MKWIFTSGIDPGKTCELFIEKINLEKYSITKNNEYNIQYIRQNLDYNLYNKNTNTWNIDVLSLRAILTAANNASDITSDDSIACLLVSDARRYFWMMPSSFSKKVECAYFLKKQHEKNRKINTVF